MRVNLTSTYQNLKSRFLSKSMKKIQFDCVGASYEAK